MTEQLRYQCRTDGELYATFCSMVDAQIWAEAESKAMDARDKVVTVEDTFGMWSPWQYLNGACVRKGTHVRDIA